MPLLPLRSFLALSLFCFCPFGLYLVYSLFNKKSILFQKIFVEINGKGL
nr:MAG TPA: hypothetical protein [Caudoviricetes sp.]